MYILSLSDAANPDVITDGGGSILMTLIPIAIMIIVFYFILIRPESKRRKQEEKMRSSLKVGDEVTTVGGVTGTICAVKEKTVVVETGADRVRIEFIKGAISSKGIQTSEDAVPEKPEKSAKSEKSDKKDK